MSEAIDATVVEGPGTELEPAPSQTLFRTDDPATVLIRATETANALMPVIRERGLVVKIQGREHLTVEAWQTLGAMVGVTPVCIWTKKLENGWEARVEARTTDGRVIGAAEAECLTDEGRWKSADDFAVRSMAQTRATSKALASVLRFVATLGGAAGTPAEEMPREGYGGGDGAATEKQRNYVATLIDRAGFSEEQLQAIREWSRGEKGMKKSAASFLIENLKDGTAEGRTAILEAAGWSDTPGDAPEMPEPDTSDFEPAPEPEKGEDDPTGTGIDF